MKKLITMLVVIIIIILNSTIIYGFSAGDMTGTDLPSGVQSSIDNFGQGIISIITTIGSICSVVVLIVIGIKYMMGSAEEKAEYKKTLLPYIIGAALVFAASTIASVIFNFASTF